jgi:hypothetical protein
VKGKGEAISQVTVRKNCYTSLGAFYRPLAASPRASLGLNYRPPIAYIGS